MADFLSFLTFVTTFVTDGSQREGPIQLDQSAEVVVEHYLRKIAMSVIYHRLDKTTDSSMAILRKLYLELWFNKKFVHLSDNHNERLV